MINENNIPTHYCIEKVTTDEESDLVSTFIRSLPGGDHYKNEEKFPKDFYVYVADNKYDISVEIYNDYLRKRATKITIEEFKKYILKLSEYQEEVINTDKELEMIINNQLLTIKGDEIIKIKNLKQKI